MKTWKRELIILIFSILITTTATVVVMGIYKDVNTEPYVVYTSISPDGMHKIELVANGLPQWPFGVQSIAIIINGAKSKISTTVANDGRKLEEYNISWNGQEATVVLSGREQKDNIFVIRFEDQGKFQVLINNDT